MRNTTVRMALFGFVLAVAHVAAQGATVRRLNLEMLVARSQRVVHGRVVATRSFWDAETRTIWTATELRVLDSAKGPLERSVVVTEPGGVLGAVGHLFPGVPQFQVNDEVVLFLHADEANRLRLTGLSQGVYTVATDSYTRQNIAWPLAREAEAVYEQGGPVVAAPRMRTVYPLPDFLDAIRQRVR